MIYSDRDTEWDTSAKGNIWRRVNGVVLVIGKKKYGESYWVMRDGEFLDGDFNSKSEAVRAAEAKISDNDDDWR
jgi:hypothetical protein